MASAEPQLHLQLLAELLNNPSRLHVTEDLLDLVSMLLKFNVHIRSGAGVDSSFFSMTFCDAGMGSAFVLSCPQCW